MNFFSFAVRNYFQGWDLVAYRVICGIGSALLLGNSNSQVTDAFPDRLGLALGITTFAIALGIAGGPLIGGSLTLLSWKWVQFFNAPFAFLALVVGLIFLKDNNSFQLISSKTSEEKLVLLKALDWHGLLLAIIFLTTFLLSFSELAFPSLGYVALICLWILVGLSFIGFFIVEWIKGPKAWFNLSLWKNKSFTISNLSNATSYFSGIFLLIF